MMDQPDTVNVKSRVSHTLLPKLSHPLSNASIMTVAPASVSSDESESSPPPSEARGCGERADPREQPSFARCQRPASTEQRRDWR